MEKPALLALIKSIKNLKKECKEKGLSKDDMKTLILIGLEFCGIFFEVKEGE